MKGWKDYEAFNIRDGSAGSWRYLSMLYLSYFPFPCPFCFNCPFFWGRLLSSSLVYCFVFVFRIPFNLLKGLIVTFFFRFLFLLFWTCSWLHASFEQCLMKWKGKIGTCFCEFLKKDWLMGCLIILVCERGEEMFEFRAMACVCWSFGVPTDGGQPRGLLSSGT